MLQQTQPKRSFFRCEKCGKKLIERLPNGCWRFVFGKTNDASFFIPVEMKIHGSLVMRCLRRTCRREHPQHWNVLNYFPPNRVQTDLINQTVESSDKTAVPVINPN
jgi:hypothetical protein